MGKYSSLLPPPRRSLAAPAHGVDSAAVIRGEYSHGNDAVILKGAGQKINLARLPASQYLVARALDTMTLEESDIQEVRHHPGRRLRRRHHQVPLRPAIHADGSRARTARGTHATPPKKQRRNWFGVGRGGSDTVFPFMNSLCHHAAIS